ncbi:MAG TPA: RsmE family RNA methyltransferase [Candidatus Paceibacterota bacterium]
MKFHRFIVDFSVNTRRFVIGDHKIVRQLHSVLRLRPGEAIMLSDGKGMEAHATIVAYTKKGCEVDVTTIRKNENEPVVQVALYASLLKKENFEFVLEKAAEIGVSEIIPVISRRTVKLALKEARAEKIIREASEQSGRGSIPKLFGPMSLKEAFFHAKKNHVNIFFEPSAPYLARSPRAPSIGVFIGPEGGWDQSEIGEARKADFLLSSLGPLILRAETAAIVASYLAVSWK